MKFHSFKYVWPPIKISFFMAHRKWNLFSILDCCCCLRNQKWKISFFLRLSLWWIGFSMVEKYGMLFTLTRWVELMDAFTVRRIFYGDVDKLEYLSEIGYFLLLSTILSSNLTFDDENFTWLMKFGTRSNFVMKIFQ